MKKIDHDFFTGCFQLPNMHLDTNIHTKKGKISQSITKNTIKLTIILYCLQTFYQTLIEKRLFYKRQNSYLLPKIILVTDKFANVQLKPAVADFARLTTNYIKFSCSHNNAAIKNNHKMQADKKIGNIFLKINNYPTTKIPLFVLRISYIPSMSSKARCLA